jgi:hypothetical protein
MAKIKATLIPEKLNCGVDGKSWAFFDLFYE